MAARLIINADDFGLTEGINRAIAELHHAGVVTSTTLMATGPAFEHAVVLASCLPALGVGCHIVLVDGTPVLPPAEIPSLLGADRESFRPTLGAFVRDLLLNRIREDEVAREAEAQIRKLQQSVVHVTHVDTHKHTHMFPPIARAVLLAARRCGVLAIRNPFEPRWSRALRQDHSSYTRLVQLAVLSRLEPSFRRLVLPDPAWQTTDGTLGIVATGSLDAPALNEILHSTVHHGDQDTTYELVCHPGYNDDDLSRVNTRLRAHREVELRALLQEVPLCREQPGFPSLVHYGDLSK